MSLLRSLARIACRQSKNLARIALGKPLTVPSLVSMTLDEDDVGLACDWLTRPMDWYREDEILQCQTEFARWNGSKYAFGFMGGRVALSACIHARDVTDAITAVRSSVMEH
jgi:hypothetical protein